MSDIEIIKLDKRHNGNEHFRYALRPSAVSKTSSSWDRIRLWRDIRAWCWATWGASLELAEWEEEHNYNLSGLRPDQNQHWAWANDGHTRKIYLKTDKELVIYKLRWE